jgi:hypothetical protein
MGVRGSCRAVSLKLGRSLALPLDQCWLLESDSLSGFLDESGTEGEYSPLTPTWRILW